MPDDDYEVVKIGDKCTCGQCTVIEEKNKQLVVRIEALLNCANDNLVDAKVKTEDFELYATIKHIIKVLRLMNDIE